MFINLFKIFSDFIIYKVQQRRYSKYFSCFFTFGNRAIRFYKKVGWDSEKLYPFMYLQNFSSLKENKKNTDSFVKGLYIGRFSFKTKGVNTLMSAIEKSNLKNTYFDFVGGYGDNKEEVISWCKKQKNVNFIGSWKPEEILTKMHSYDYVVVPSLYDGWNLACQQSVLAEIGCIVTDKAGSDDLIRMSKSGSVIPSRNPAKLSILLKKLDKEPNILNHWKNSAHNFKEKISIDSVGNYFINVISFSFERNGEKPQCPWETEK